MRPERGALWLAALLVPSLLAAQDSIRLRLQPPPNTAITYRMRMEMWMSGPGLPDSTVPTMTMTGRWTVVLLAARADTFDFQVTLDSLDAASPMVSAMPSPPVEGRVDTVPIDSRGIPVWSPERLQRASERYATASVSWMPRMSNAADQPGFFAFPTRSLAIGTTWGDTTVSRSDSSPAGSFSSSMRSAHRLERIVQDGARRVAVISNTTWLEMAMAQGQAHFNGTGIVEVDMATGMVLRSSDTTEGAMEMGGMRIPMRMRASVDRAP